MNYYIFNIQIRKFNQFCTQSYYSFIRTAAPSPSTRRRRWAETRPAKYVQKLRDELNETKIHNRTGARFHSSFWTAKLLWMREENDGVFHKTAKWLSFSDYVAYRLSVQYVTGVSMASGTGIFDIRNCVWDQELVDFLQIDSSKLPEICSDDFMFQTNRWERLKNATRPQKVVTNASVRTPRALPTTLNRNDQRTHETRTSLR